MPEEKQIAQPVYYGIWIDNLKRWGVDANGVLINCPNVGVVSAKLFEWWESSPDLKLKLAVFAVDGSPVFDFKIEGPKVIIGGTTLTSAGGE